MNNKSKVITAILSILIIVLYFVNEKNDYKFDEASKAYQIYLDGKEIGLIKDENELYSLINKEQQNIKDQYGVDYVYPPDGLDIVETKTFDGKYYVGRTYMDIPEEDGLVFIPKNNIQNTWIRIKITNVKNYDLIGETLG